MFDRISMIGLGYIGLPTATLFASRKKTATVLNVPARVVEDIVPGRVRFAGPKRGSLAHSSVMEDRLRGSLTPEPAMSGRRIDTVGGLG